MNKISIVIIIAVINFMMSSVYGEEGLVAHYTFDEGSGTVVKDISGNGNDGTINGAEFVKLKSGYALKFNGVDNYVDCGKGPSLDITDVITIEAWICPEGIPTVPSEWIIVGKTYDNCALCYYMDGRAWWYISKGDNACAATVSEGQWHHLVGTFDGKAMSLYVDGEEKSSKSSKYPAMDSRKDLSLLIGRSPFRGMVDDVRIYHRALSSEEVGKHYQLEKADKLTGSSQIEKGEILEGNGFILKVGNKGGMELSIGEDSYLFESTFSYPDENIGTNSLSEELRGEPVWKPKTEKSGEEAWIKGKGKFYSLDRKVRLENGRIKVEDTFTNVENSPVGILIQNHIITPETFRKCLLGGMPESTISESGANPTIFISQNESHLGVVSEDNISRLRYEASWGLNRATFSVRHFALAPGKSYTIKWAIYPMDKDADYFTMINLIREDWKTNFTVQGPFEFGDIYPERFPTPDVLKTQLRRKPVKIFALTPFLEYPSYNRMSRSDFKKNAVETMKILKTADPDIKCLGSIEASLVSVYPEKVKGGEKLERFIETWQGTTYPPLPAEMTKILEEANLPWKDSYVRTSEELLQMEIYKAGGNTQTALVVSPEIGNYQYKYLIDQVKFLIDDVEMDGIYFDTFGWGPEYSKWDEFSVDIDPITGKIIKQYNDTTLSSAKVRNEVCNYILSKGKIVVENGGNTVVKEDQALPIFRIVENDPLPFQSGQKPPFNSRVCRLQLGSPVALMGAWGSAENIYKAVITYLSGGTVCYFYNSNFPESGEGSGDYGPFHHMFPITPVALHEGWIEGKERIITCVSGNYIWKGKGKPVVYLFDSNGRGKEHNFATEKGTDSWNIKVNLKNWEEIVVIEDMTVSGGDR